MSEIIKNYCKRCDYETNHKVLFKERFRSPDELGYDFIIEYMVVKCLGCETTSFREEFINLETAYPDENGDWTPEITITNYPKKDRIVKRLDNVHALPDKIKSIYNEAVNSYNADCPILTGVAFRAVIEAICIEEKIQGYNLEKKINNLVRQKLITEKEARRLHSIRFIGNDSVHEMKAPKEKSLKIVLNIIEHLLNNLYLIDYDSDGVLETIIDEYPKFEELLSQCVKKMNNGDEVPLAKILSTNIRRLNGKLNDFETKLIEQINNGDYTMLSIGKVDAYGNDSTPRQHFIIKNNR
jgi:hypothetical protein